MKFFIKIYYLSLIIYVIKTIQTKINKRNKSHNIQLLNSIKYLLIDYVTNFL